jgi:triosephosphate isomerase
MKRYVVGNWKCHKNSAAGCTWLDDFSRQYSPVSSLEVLLAPTFLSLEAMSAYARQLQLGGFSLAAQDVSPFPMGSYTGAIAADLLKKYVKYVIVGHSERRRYFHETEQDLINKVTEAADAGIVPIVCIDEGEAILSKLSPLKDVECDELIIAYTPVDALNFKIPEAPEILSASIEKIHSYFPSWPVIYGGALLPENVERYLSVDGLAGLFVGSASLDAESFAAICRKAAQ